MGKRVLECDIDRVLRLHFPDRELSIIVTIKHLGPHGWMQKDAETDFPADADFLNTETTKALLLLEKQGFSVVAGRGLEPRTHAFSGKPF